MFKRALLIAFIACFITGTIAMAQDETIAPDATSADQPATPAGESAPAPETKPDAARPSGATQDEIDLQNALQKEMDEKKAQAAPQQEKKLEEKKAEDKNSDTKKEDGKKDADQAADDKKTEAPVSDSSDASQPAEEPPPPPLLPSGQMEERQIAVLRTIDKLSARTHTFEVPVDKTVKFGNSLYIKVRACRVSSPVDKPEAAAFLQIWERPDNNDSKWIFSGWMFASSPSLSAMDHPVYDVWVIECKSATTATKSESFSNEALPDKSPEKSGEVPAAKPDDKPTDKSTGKPADKSETSPEKGAEKETALPPD